MHLIYLTSSRSRRPCLLIQEHRIRGSRWLQRLLIVLRRTQCLVAPARKAGPWQCDRCASAEARRKGAFLVITQLCFLWVITLGSLGIPTVICVRDTDGRSWIIFRTLRVETSLEMASVMHTSRQRQLRRHRLQRHDCLCGSLATSYVNPS